MHDQHTLYQKLLYVVCWILLGVILIIGILKIIGA